MWLPTAIQRVAAGVINTNKKVARHTCSCGLLLGAYLRLPPLTFLTSVRPLRKLSAKVRRMNQSLLQSLHRLWRFGGVIKNTGTTFAINKSQWAQVELK